jgi:hypothetical protein
MIGKAFKKQGYFVKHPLEVNNFAKNKAILRQCRNVEITVSNNYAVKGFGDISESLREESWKRTSKK